MTQATTSTNHNNLSNNASKIAFVMAPSGTGKTFTGDYLACMHGYEHVDGDVPLKNGHLPHYTDMAQKFWTVFCEYLSKNEDGPEEMWHPYFDELARMTLKATETSEKVVLTHATYRQAWQEYVIQKLVDGGVSPDQISIVALTIDEDVKLRALYLRTREMLKDAGVTLEKHCRDQYGWEGEGEITYEEFASFAKGDALQSAVFQDPPAGSTSVNVSSRNFDTLDAIDEALGLGKRTAGEKYEEIVSRVKAIDAKRDEEYKKIIAKYHDTEEYKQNNKRMTASKDDNKGCLQH